MNKLSALLALLLATAPGTALSQAVPEGVHRDASGPFEMCGFAATDVADLKAKVRESERFQQTPIDTDRFELYSASDPLQQITFTNSSEAAYPAVTCRHLYEEDGRLRMARSMRCDAGREECDALFIEFRELDAQMTRSLQGRD